MCGDQMDGKCHVTWSQSLLVIVDGEEERVKGMEEGNDRRGRVALESLAVGTGSAIFPVGTIALHCRSSLQTLLQHHTTLFSTTPFCPVIPPLFGTRDPYITRTTSQSFGDIVAADLVQHLIRIDCDRNPSLWTEPSCWPTSRVISRTHACSAQ